MNDTNAKQVKAKAAKVRKAVCAACGVNAAYENWVKAAKENGRDCLNGLDCIVTSLVKSTAFNHQQAVKVEAVQDCAARDGVHAAYMTLVDCIASSAKQYLFHEGFKLVQTDNQGRLVFLAA